MPRKRRGRTHRAAGSLFKDGKLLAINPSVDPGQRGYHNHDSYGSHPTFTKHRDLGEWIRGVNLVLRDTAEYNLEYVKETLKLSDHQFIEILEKANAEGTTTEDMVTLLISAVDKVIERYD